MSRWPSFNLSIGSKVSNLPGDDGVEELPDFYRMLDPLYTNKKRDYGGVYSRYRDEEGVLHQPTYRPFPPLVPPPKKLPPDERPTYVERMRLPPPEELPPTPTAPKIPPWKLPPKPQPSKKVKRRSDKAANGQSKTLMVEGSAINTGGPQSQQEACPGQNGEIHIPNTEFGHEGSEHQSYARLLFQAKKMVSGILEAACGCIHGHKEPQVQL